MPWSSLTLSKVGEFLCLFGVLSARPDIARVVGVGMKPSSESQLHLPFENETRHLFLIVGYFCCWLKIFFFSKSHSASEIRLIWNGINCLSVLCQTTLPNNYIKYSLQGRLSFYLSERTVQNINTHHARLREPACSWVFTQDGCISSPLWEPGSGKIVITIYLRTQRTFLYHFHWRYQL